MYETLGDLLKDKRLKYKMSVRNLSNLSGISVSSISRIENNKTKPFFEDIVILTEILNLDIEEDVLCNIKFDYAMDKFNKIYERRIKND